MRQEKGNQQDAASSHEKGIRTRSWDARRRVSEEGPCPWSVLLAEWVPIGPARFGPSWSPSPRAVSGRRRAAVTGLLLFLLRGLSFWLVGPRAAREL